MGDETQSEVAYDYDVAVSYAGEDRQYVSQVVEALKARSIRPFYDQDELAAMWGENLVDFLQAVYARRARYAILFISAAYVEKKWTNHERKSAQDRALQDASPYILPVKLDSVDLPGMHSTVAYLDARHTSVEKIAEVIAAKLGVSEGSNAEPPDRVALTPEEIQVLLQRRPPAWEHLLFASTLRLGLQDHEPLYLDHVLEYAPIEGDEIHDDAILPAVRSVVSKLVQIVPQLDRLMSEGSQTAAFGEPGEPGDSDRITHLARRVVDVYADLLRWAREKRSANTTNDALRELNFAAAHYVDQPIEAIRDFAERLAADLTGIGAKIERQEKVKLVYEIHFELPQELTDRVQRLAEKVIEDRSAE